MINFRFNDKEYIEDMININYVNKDNPMETVLELARYNYHVLGLDKEASYDAILEYMHRNKSDFYEEAYIKKIYQYISGVKKYKFRNVNSVQITKSELDCIEALGDIKKEKIAFVLLATAKYYNCVSEDNENRVYISIMDIFKLARVSLNRDERAPFLHFSYKEGILEPHMGLSTDLKIVNIVSKDESDLTVLELRESDYLELAYVYLNYKNKGGYKRCKACGRLFKLTKKTHARMYCSMCQKEKKEATEDYPISYCIDCGAKILIYDRSANKCRCEECQANEIKRIKREWWRKNMSKKLE